MMLTCGAKGELIFFSLSPNLLSLSLQKMLEINLFFPTNYAENINVRTHITCMSVCNQELYHS